MPKTAEVPTLPPHQQPDWESEVDLAVVDEELRSRRPLVDAGSCHALRRELEIVTRGDALVIQGGDCAERFAESTAPHIQAKAAQLDELGDIVERVADLPVVRVGRFAGQYAKPRSNPLESLPDGTVLPVYRGDAVNDPEPTPCARKADARRLLLAYDHAAEALDALFLNQFLLPMAGVSPTYVSHEALLLDFERALVRPDDVCGGRYGSSGHMLWIGERTRQLDGAHLAFAAEVNNPIGVKIGPTTTPDQLAAIIDLLAVGHPAGRLTLIIRMGAGAIADRLPSLLTTAGASARDLVWLCDPMHGNMIRTSSGQKTRVVADVLSEVEQFCTTLHAYDVHPGGLHLELTPDAVTECVDTHDRLATPGILHRFLSVCDPRLDPSQAERVVRLMADLVRC
ncbi:3-deoxy-7-phosphoheptulonate synthase [Nocardia sp. NPDC052566]|uniref:3-deoxy-7-phosphoheptulonate synthase n=1 Tax=Nocardia sp. NPDC052566 TaxID=3364330 RepID=UPI0037C91A52